MMSFRPSDRFPAFIETLCAVLVFCVAVIPPSPSTCHAQPRDLIDIKGENPEQRKIMQLLRQLESIEHDQVLQATDAFDARMGNGSSPRRSPAESEHGRSGNS